NKQSYSSLPANCLHLSAHLPHYYRIIYSVTMWLFSLKTTTFAVSLINDEQNPFIHAPIKPHIPKMPP
ncbi:MAG: hypothetical protein ACRCT0_00510, partial [Plesiomonas shigelloides]